MMMMPEDVRSQILVVEDDVSIRLLLQHCLRSHFKIQVVGHVDEALHLAIQDSFDLFILDINLGEHRTGIDLLHLLRQIPEHQTTPAVACTAHTSPDDRRHLLNEGFNDHLGKPFTRDQLLNKISILLNNNTSYSKQNAAA